MYKMSKNIITSKSVCRLIFKGVLEIMEKILSKDIRNVCLLGHSSDGKTSLIEAMLYMSGATDRLGKVTEGNTVCDYDAEEIKRGFSISSAIAPVVWRGIKLNFIDTPGYLDFIGEVKQALRVAASAVVVIDGKAGIEVGTELAFDQADAARIPCAVFVNKVEDPDSRFNKVFKSLRDRFGVGVCPITVPLLKGPKVEGVIDLLDFKAYTFDKTGKATQVDIPAEHMEEAKEYHNMLLESVAESSEELMDKFFAGEEISRAEAIQAFEIGFEKREIIPVYCGSAMECWGIDLFLDSFRHIAPSPFGKKYETVMDGDKEERVLITEDGPTGIFVFKTIADPFVGKMSFFKVMNGTVCRDQVLYNLTTGQSEKMAHIYLLRGKKQTEVDEILTGDIGMTAKLAATNTNDTLSSDPNGKMYKKIVYPESYMQMAIAPKAKGDEDKISSGIAKLLEEDRTLRFENNAETKQLLIAGQGDIHLDVVVSKLKNRFGTAVELTVPKIAYRETIKRKVNAEGKHKKQSGGHGQYGHVKISFEPGERTGLEFSETIFGGSVPKNYHPAVEKGLLESMQKGILAGYPVVHLKANLYDGSYHDVDSSEMAFKLAANLAFKEGMRLANPVILEPVAKVMVYVPDYMMGDVIGGINKRRGRVLGMSPTAKSGEQMIEAEVPMAEMNDYTIALRAMTQGRGRFSMKFERYEEAPTPVAAKIIEESKKNAESDG